MIIHYIVIEALWLFYQKIFFFSLGKFNLKALYERIGFNKETISKGRFAELLAAEQRPFR